MFWLKLEPCEAHWVSALGIQGRKGCRWLEHLERSPETGDERDTGQGWEVRATRVEESGRPARDRCRKQRSLWSDSLVALEHVGGGAREGARQWGQPHLGQGLQEKSSPHPLLLCISSCVLLKFYSK